MRSDADSKSTAAVSMPASFKAASSARQSSPAKPHPVKRMRSFVGSGRFPSEKRPRGRLSNWRQVPWKESMPAHCASRRRRLPPRKRALGLGRRRRKGGRSAVSATDVRFKASSSRAAAVRTITPPSTPGSRRSMRFARLRRRQAPASAGRFGRRRRRAQDHRLRPSPKLRRSLAPARVGEAPRRTEIKI